MSARTGQSQNRRRVRPARRVSTARLVCSIIICVVFAAGTAAGATKTGASIASAMQRFLTFYSGVFALVALTAAVVAGLAATDRIILSPGSRIVAQAVHRALAFIAVAFLATHIMLEIMIGKSQVIDSVVPFLSRGRTFYIGIGTIASDLMVLIAATGIARRRFAERASPVAWRVLHGTAYVAWPLSVVHGLAAGRQPKPYVSWSYGACMIAVGLALVIRSVATIRPPQRAVQAWPDGEDAPLRAAAIAAAHAYLLRSQQLTTPADTRPGRQEPSAAPMPGAPAGVAAEHPDAQVLQWPGAPAPQSPGAASARQTAAAARRVPLASALLNQTPSTLASSTQVPLAQAPPAEVPPGEVPAGEVPADRFGPPTPPAGTRAAAPPAGRHAAAPPAGRHAHTPADRVRNQTPGEEIPVSPQLASVPYQMQALHPAEPGEDPPRSAAG